MLFTENTFNWQTFIAEAVECGNYIPRDPQTK